MLYVILPSLIIIGIFALIFLITFIQQWLRGPKLSEQLAETRAEIEETLDSYGKRRMRMCRKRIQISIWTELWR